MTKEPQKNSTRVETQCCVCETYKTEEGTWNPEYKPSGDYLTSHGYCPPCFETEMQKMERETRDIKYKL